MALDTLVAAKALERVGMENGQAHLDALVGRFRGALHKALWVFSLGVICANAVVIGAAFSIALWLWPPGAG